MINELFLLNSDYSMRISSGHSQFLFKKGINLLIGENGSGKSTLLKLISDGNISISKGDISVTLINPKEQFDVRFIDMSAQGKNRDVSNESGAVYRHALLSHFRSHGESNKPILSALKNFADGTLVVIDEPELALDFENINDFIQIIKNESARLNFIISTHNPLIIRMPEAHCISLSKNSDYKSCLLEAYR
jgi:predicted ATPase